MKDDCFLLVKELVLRKSLQRIGARSLVKDYIEETFEDTRLNEIRLGKPMEVRECKGKALSKSAVWFECEYLRIEQCHSETSPSYFYKSLLSFDSKYPLTYLVLSDILVQDLFFPFFI